ncbi:MAG: GAF domain-containing protein [Candidatus Cloacimonetes bacterium]|nr:GAF domain-containing protein [Candidatus Cloacimonadota bacterium]
MDKLIKEIDSLPNKIMINDNNWTVYSILNTLPDSALILNTRGFILAFNEVARQILCNNDKNPTGKNLLNYFSRDSYNFLKSNAKEVIRTKKPISFKDNQNNRIFNFTIYPVLNKDKIVSQLTVFGRDVSENIRLEESEYQKTVQLERLLQTSRYLSSSLDVIEVLTRISTEAKEILNSYGTTIYLLDEDGRTLNPKVVIDPIYEEEILDTPLDIDNSYTGKAVKAKKAIMFNSASSSEGGFQVPETSEVEDERVIVAPFIVNDEVIGALCLNRIGPIYTEEELALADTFAAYASIALKNAQVHLELKHEVEIRKNTEIELQNHREQLKLINRILRHDLMNNLATIKSAIHLIKANSSVEMLDECDNIINRSANLIHRMRELETFTSKHMNLRLFDIRKVLTEICQNYKQMNISISGKGSVLADESLSSAIENIIRNAEIHSGTNSLDIEIKNHKNFCDIYFIDYGIGISDENKEKIFEEGFKSGKSGNSGLGLYIVKKAAENYGGSVFILDSEPSGTTIILSLKKIR